MPARRLLVPAALAATIGLWAGSAARMATNAQIAQALVIAPKTVDHHVSAVLGKLGVASRREAGEAAQRLHAEGQNASARA